MRKNEVWTGLINLAPKINCQYLTKQELAYTNIVIYAENIQDFKIKTTEFLENLGFIIISFEDIGTVSSLKRKNELSKEIARLLLLVENEKTPKLTKLHVYNMET